MNDWVLAADIGGTRVRAAAVDRGGAVVARREIASALMTGPDEAVRLIAELLGTVREEAGVAPAAVCLGTPGLVDADRGVIIIAANVAGFRNLALAGAVQERLKLPASSTPISNAASSRPKPSPTPI